MKELIENTILIVEDTPENIDILVGLLEDFQLKIAINGKDALEIAFEEYPPDLILLDIMMPEMDGYEVCKLLRQNEKTKDVPIIFLTAKTEKEDIIKGFEVGGQDYLTKPFDARELMERVKTQLELKNQREILKNMNVILEDKVQERTAQLNESNLNLENANKKLLGLDVAKNKFLSLISHEIRTPLNGIVGSSDFLSDYIDDPEMKELVDMLLESVDRLVNFSQKALEITNLQTNGNAQEKIEVNVNPIIESVLELKKDKAQLKNVILQSSLIDEDKITVVVDHISRIMEELIANAIKFSNRDGIVELKTFIEEGRFKISITDTGEVIPEEKIEEIVKPFGLANEHYDQTIGLGLNYVHTALEIHGATLKIVSNKEETVFTIGFNLLPVA